MAIGTNQLLDNQFENNLEIHKKKTTNKFMHNTFKKYINTHEHTCIEVCTDICTY